MKKLLLLCLLALQGSVFGEQNKILLESEYWPYRVATSEIITANEKVLRAGTVGVLVRAESEAETVSLVVDFGRNGVQRVNADQTDLHIRISEIKSGEVQKLLPNYVNMLANKFAVLLPESNYKLKLEEFESRDGFVFIYSSGLSHLETLLNQVGAATDLINHIVIVIPEAGEPELEAVREVIRSHPVAAAVFLPHLSEPYRNTLSHAVESNSIVVTNMDGYVTEQAEISVVNE